RASGPPGLPVSILSTGKGPKNQRCEEKVGRPRRPEEQGLIYPWLTAGSRCDKPSIPQSCAYKPDAPARDDFVPRWRVGLVWSLRTGKGRGGATSRRHPPSRRRRTA